MGKLLQLLIRNGGLLTFVLVEAFSFWLVVQCNERQNAIFTHSAGVWGGNLLASRQKVVDYLSLTEQADSLRSENMQLQAELANARMVSLPYRDTFITVLFDTINPVDSVRRRMMRPLYEFYSGQVIGNSISNENNWVIINRGSKDHITANMGVVTRNGIVGIVRHVSPDFCMAMSVLHHQSRISVALKKQQAFGSMIWEGGDPNELTLKFIPRHFTVSIGDTVITSGYSSMFPKSVPVAVVTQNPMQDPENPYFWMLKVRPTQDMSTVHEVYLVSNLFKVQVDSLTKKSEENE